MRASRIIMLVAEVSSSMSSTSAPASTASTVDAAWLVEPDALVVEKSSVGSPDGRCATNADTSSWITARPSSARSFTASGRVTTCSRPSPGTWS
jgi:hypothetical protein